MSITATQTMYRQEFIAKFEKGESVLRKAVTTEHLTKGGAAVFMTSGSGSATAVSRGVNGMIPSRNMDFDQYTANLVEWHDKPILTGFNVFTSQGDTIRAMRESSMKVVNRKIDSDIRSALSGATNTTGAAATASLTLVAKAVTMLRNNYVDPSISLYGVVTPAFPMMLMKDFPTQFASADFVNDKRFEGVGKDKAFNWMGVNWIVDSELDGVGTASATCFLFAKEAIGHACNVENVSTLLGYDEEDDYSFARTSIYMGSKLLQNSGVIKIIHNDSSLSA